MKIDQQCPELIRRVFVGIFGVHTFAFRERAHAAPYLHFQVVTRFTVHFDTTERRV